jgi:hypothetical protein
VNGGRERPAAVVMRPLSCRRTLQRGTPAQAGERFAAYAGATWLVLGTISEDWHTQLKLIAQAATLLD